ncbi:MAG: helix-turn-helix transcriptional regulator [Candidatus Thiodiazotropha sp.]
MNIGDARKQAVFTQVQLSEAAGIDLASIIRMENGNSTHE